MKNVMKKAAALCLALVLLCATALAGETAPEPALATVDGVDVPVGAAQNDLNYYAAQYSYYAQAYGLTDWLDGLKADIAQYYVRLYLMKREAEEMEITLTDEEIQALTEEADALYDETLTEYITYFRTEDMTDEEAVATVEAWLAEQSFTREWIRQSKIDDAILTRYEAVITEGAEASEEDVKAEYDQRVSDQQARFEASADEFGSAALNSEVIYYVPEGYRSVYHILLLLSDEDQATLRGLNGDLSAAQTALESGEGDEEALKAQIEELETQKKALLQPLYDRMAEVQKRLDDGEDFKALIAEYNEDPGMMNEPTASQGYYIWADSELWEMSFRDAAMAIAEVGGVSEPVDTAYGLHLIYYDHDLEAGPVDFDTIKDSLKTELDESLRADRLNAHVQELMDNAVIEYHLENLIYDDGTAEEAPADEAGADEEAGEAEATEETEATETTEETEETEETEATEETGEAEVTEENEKTEETDEAEG